MKTEKLPMCKFFTTTGYPRFQPKCIEGLYANLTCHEENTKRCSKYEPSLGIAKPEVKKPKAKQGRLFESREA